MMKRYFVLFFLLTLLTRLAGQTLEAERLPDMNVPRAGHNVFYAGGELTVVGGHTSGFVMTPTAEYFSNGTWHLMPTVYQHDDGMAVVMDNGKKVLLAGGHDKNLGIGQSFEVEMYNSLTHAFEGFGSLDRSRALAQGVELVDGQVLITGNHKDNDAIELFDGKRSFREVKDVSIWRSSPYLLPISNDDVIAFGAVWREGFQPCDTVERLNGEPFQVPLLQEWLPLLYDQNNHATESFIGDKIAGDYSYLIAAYNHDGEMAFIHIQDTVFSLLTTTNTVPLASEWGAIKYDRPAVADRQAHRAYLVGNDTTGRVYVVTVEYDKQPASLTVSITDPLPDFGDATPVLTPDGDLIIAGGITDDNFTPFASVWLLHTGTQKAVVAAETQRSWTWLWVLCGLLVITAVVAIIRHCEERQRRSNPKHNDESDELLSRIIELMEAQRLFLNSELKVTDVADALGVHRNAVSACINAQKGCSFNQFINDYRLEHAKKLLRETPDLKISTISLESGFATEGTFFRVFKADTGMTPKEWAEKN
jgi:AraC-like DNA-binding protein